MLPQFLLRSYSYNHRIHHHRQILQTRDYCQIAHIIQDLVHKLAFQDIPIQKWINVIIRVQNKNLDVYINGRLVKRRILNNVVKQNYDNVNVSINGGFNGYLSQLTYFNRAIGVAHIQDIVYNGPNLKASNDALNQNKPRYLAERWYFDQTE